MPSACALTISRCVCTLAIYFQVTPEHPLVIAANRDEFYDRPAAAPKRLSEDPWIVAGQDLSAGGTWFGVNGHGIAAGILNRRGATPPDATRHSRGLLCLEALRQAAVVDAVRLVRDQPADRFNPFNLLLASPRAAAVVGNVTGTMVVTALPPGLHLLTNLDLDDFECPRIAKSYRLFEDVQRSLASSEIPQIIKVLRGILADHSTPLDPRSALPPNNLCVHTERFGTRSSSIVIYSAATQQFRMWHADGAPCRTPYTEVLLPYSPKKR